MENTFNEKELKGLISRFVLDERNGPFLFTILTCLIEKSNALFISSTPELVDVIKETFSLEYLDISLKNLSVYGFCEVVKATSICISLLLFVF